jgi:hypothetical protein
MPNLAEGLRGLEDACAVAGDGDGVAVGPELLGQLQADAGRAAGDQGQRAGWSRWT